MDQNKKKFPDAVLLLRKSHKDGHVPVLKRDVFPVRFAAEGSVYRINRTKAGKIVMNKE